MRRMRTSSVATAALFAATIAIAGACADANPTAPANIPGTYVLQTINGHALPDTVPNTVGQTRVVSSATAILTVAATDTDVNTYAFKGTGTQDGVASAVLADSGSWTQDGGKLNFVSDSVSSGFYFAIATPSAITVTLPGGFLNSTTGTFSLVLVKAN